MKRLSITDKKIAAIIQGDIPLVPKPFHAIGSRLGITGDEVLNIVRTFLDDGYIRRFGAVLRHNQAGFIKNALIVWAVPPNLMEQTGQTMAGFSFVSHCYAREPAFQDKYNLFTMVHTRKDNLKELIDKMSQAVNINDFLVLESIQEYKKISPEYFK